MSEPKESNPLREFIRTHPCQGFRSRAVYFITGDFTLCYFEDAPCHAEDDTCENVTVYRANDDNRIVGFKIWSPDALRHEAVQRAYDAMAEARPRWTKLANPIMPVACLVLMLGAFLLMGWMRHDVFGRFPWVMSYLLGVCLPAAVLFAVAVTKATPDEVRRMKR